MTDKKPPSGAVFLRAQLAQVKAAPPAACYNRAHTIPTDHPP